MVLPSANLHCPSICIKSSPSVSSPPLQASSILRSQLLLSSLPSSSTDPPTGFICAVVGNGSGLPMLPSNLGPPPAFLPTPPPLPPRPLAWPVCLVRFSLTLPPPPLLWVLPPSPALPHPPSPNHRASPHSTGCVGGRRKEGRRGGGCRAR
jgi:hypothetical protein